MTGNTEETATLLQQLSDEIAALTRTTAAPQSDAATNARIDELFDLTIRLAQAPVLSAADLDLKLAVLCRRLREHLEPDNRGAVLTYLLAEAVRYDVSLLELPSHAEPNAHCPLRASTAPDQRAGSV